MAAQLAVPEPMTGMMGYLHINPGEGFHAMPIEMEDAATRCRLCKAFDFCDEDIESRYFTCPNRDLFDRLERMQGLI